MTSTPREPPPGATRAGSSVEDLFHREYGRVVATVVRLVRDLDAAEEIVQDALAAALDRWPLAGMPDNPGGWLMTTARNRAFDVLRRRRRLAARAEALAREAGLADVPEPAGDPEPIADDRLRLIFTCCHPTLAPESQVALTLRLVAGLSTAEIARAFLVSEATIAQRLVRAKRLIRARRLPYVVPAPAEMAERLPPALAVIYLVFTAGYTAREGASLVRLDLCEEAARLAGILVELMPGGPEVLGLAALLELQASRAPARTDAAGELVLLADQDRGRWDQPRIGRALALLEAAGPLDDAGPYQLQAAIAACHARAPSWEATDWKRIASLYAALEGAMPSPVVGLNRAVAVGMADGPAAGLATLDGLDPMPCPAITCSPRPAPTSSAASGAAPRRRASTPAPSPSPPTASSRPSSAAASPSASPPHPTPEELCAPSAGFAGAIESWGEAGAGGPLGPPRRRKGGEAPLRAINDERRGCGRRGQSR